MSKNTNTDKDMYPKGEASVTCGFFNSVETTDSDGNKLADRLYDAVDMSSIFDGLINDGIFASIGDNLVVKASSGNVVQVGTGKCWFNHTWTLNDAPLLINCGAADTTRSRIDAIVVEVNNNDDVRDNFIKVIHGEPSTSPSKPTLTKSERVNQHALAYITRKPGTTSITQANIENAVGTSATPFVTGIVQVTSLDELLGQWTDQLNRYIDAGEAEIDSFISTEETKFKNQLEEMRTLMQEFAIELNDWTAAEKSVIINWFNDIKGQLSDEPAINLQSQINADEVERFLIDGLPDGTKTFSEDGSVVKTVDSKGRVLVKTFTDDFHTVTSVLKTREDTEYLWAQAYEQIIIGGHTTYGWTKKTQDGVTFTNNGDHTITVNGTATANVYAQLSDADFALEPDVYSLSGCPVGGSAKTYYFGACWGDDSTQLAEDNVKDTGYGVELDLTVKTVTQVLVYICIKSGTTVSNLLFKPKIMTVGSEMGRLVKKISTDGNTIETTLTNKSEVIPLPDLLEIEKGIDAIIETENDYIGGDDA